MKSTRRQLLRKGALLGTGVLGGMSASGWAAAGGEPATKRENTLAGVVKPTAYIAAYDTERPGCLAACRKIVEVHRRLRFPATFFIVGRTLESAPDEYRRLLDDPLFEIASHTFSHKLLRDHPICGDRVPPHDLRNEIFASKATIERTFQRPCVGIRSACGFTNGLTGAANALALVAQAGYRYSSSLLWGPDYSMPALLREPYSYKADGHPGIWEIPGHGWHENLLKNNNKWGAKRLTLWPPPMPEAIPRTFLQSPDEEFALNRVFLDHAAAGTQSYVSFVWHPWSLGAFDPEMRMLEMTFAHVRALGMTPTTYAQLCEKLSRMV